MGVGKLKRIKNVFGRIKNGFKKLKDKVIKPMVKFIADKAPGVLKILVKAIKAADKVGARKLLINLIPEAGGYINQVIDILISAEEKGLFDKVFDMLREVIDGKFNIQSFISQVRDIVGIGREIKDEQTPIKLPKIKGKTLPTVTERRNDMISRVKAVAPLSETQSEFLISDEDDLIDEENMNAEDAIFGENLN